MADPFMAYCGIDCEACTYREKMNCPGCPATEGKPFWGVCRVAQCCREKGHEHCGQCGEFPCEMLKEFAYHETQGDNGARIEHARAWAAEGYEAWRERQGTGDRELGVGNGRR